MGNKKTRQSGGFFTGISMPKEGFEPSRDCSHHALNVARLPIPPLRLICGLNFIAKNGFVNQYSTFNGILPPVRG
jgi:hypothetical protein